jgi:membrane protease YdiL (CAAX protease family)
VCFGKGGEVSGSIDLKRIVIFSAFAFGIAWTGGTILYLTGGLANDLRTILLLTVAYMGAPALAHVLTRWLTREGWHDVRLRPRLRQGWPYWIACWFGPGLLTLAGAAVFFALFPRYFDTSLSTVRQLLQTAAGQIGQPLEINPWLVVVVQTAQGMLLAPIVNAIPIFGEEFGWRAYLLPKLMPLGGRKAVLLLGVIWGVWHWPVIAMGHNYGLDYPGAPWLGMLLMVWFCLALGTCLSWAALRGGSVWPAVVGHGAINGIAGIGVFFVRGQPSPLLGPLPVGLVGSAGFIAVALAILMWRGALDPR